VVTAVEDPCPCCSQASGQIHSGLLGDGNRDIHAGFKYIADLDLVLGEIGRVLVPLGKAIFVVGDSTIRGTFVKNSEIINRLAVRHGLRLTKKFSRELLNGRRYLPPPAGAAGADPGLSERMRREVIMHFAKPDICRRTSRRQARR
jgi:hypothetical protein